MSDNRYVYLAPVEAVQLPKGGFICVNIIRKTDCCLLCYRCLLFFLAALGEVKSLPKAMSVSSSLPPVIPSNPSASEEAKQLLSNLVNLRGKGFCPTSMII